jgi:hypothetical protein
VDCKGSFDGRVSYRRKNSMLDGRKAKSVADKSFVVDSDKEKKPKPEKQAAETITHSVSCRSCTTRSRDC